MLSQMSLPSIPHPSPLLNPPPPPPPLPSSPHLPRRRRLWINPNPHHRHTLRRRRQNQNQNQNQYVDRTVDMPSLLSSLRLTTSSSQLHSLMSQYVSSQNAPLLSPRFLSSLLSHLRTDHRRSLSLLDWSLPLYQPPSLLLLPYNLTIRNSLLSHDFPLALGLLHELRSLRPSLSPDPFTYSLLISSLSRHRHLHAALSLLPLMEDDSIIPDLVLFTNLISLARSLNDHSKAIALFSRLRALGIPPDLIAYNVVVSVYASAGLFRDARNLFDEMRDRDRHDEEV